jgi:hypothetical protein
MALEGVLPADVAPVTSHRDQRSTRMLHHSYLSKAIGSAAPAPRDGHNRLKACDKAKVGPRFEDFKGTEEAARALVISLNMHRRDLTPAQRAIVAARFWMANADGKPGPKRSLETPTNSVNAIAKQFATSGKSVLQARDLLAEADDLVERVSAGSMFLSDATKELAERRAAIAEEKRQLERTEAYRDLIESGKMTLREAIQRIDAEAKEREEKSKRQNCPPRGTATTLLGRLRRDQNHIHGTTEQRPSDAASLSPLKSHRVRRTRSALAHHQLPEYQEPELLPRLRIPPRPRRHREARGKQLPCRYGVVSSRDRMMASPLHRFAHGHRPQPPFRRTGPASRSAR